MKQSLMKKICVMGIGLAAGFVLLNLLLTYFLLIPFSIYTSQSQMKKLADSFTRLELQDEQKVMEYMEEMEEDTNTQVTIFDREMMVQYSTKMSDYEPQPMGQKSRDYIESNLGELDAGRVLAYSRGEERDGGRIHVIVVKKIAEDRYVRLSRSYRSLQNATHSAMIFEMIVGIVLVLLSTVVVYRFGLYLVVPIRKLTETAGRISNLEFDLKAEVTGEDEIGMLGTAVNRMSVHLKENFDALQADVESRKKLVRNLSHEIKSPIAVIMGYADRLKSIIRRDPEKAVSYCEIISRECVRVDGIVQEMLELSRLENHRDTMQTDLIRSVEFFGKLRERFEAHCADSQPLYVEQYEPEDSFYGDFRLLQRAVFNLLKNAVAYGDQEQLRIEVSGRKGLTHYEIAVYNTGKHIPVEEKDSLWDPFVKADQARSRGSGSGIGLSIVREIVEAHQGYCDIRNIADGVQFVIGIPLPVSCMEETEDVEL